MATPSTETSPIPPDRENLRSLPLPSFARRLAMAIIALNIIVMGLATYLLDISRRETIEQAKITGKNLSQVLELDITAMIEKTDMALCAIIDEIQKQEAKGRIDTGALDRFLDRQKSFLEGFQELRVTDARGTIIAGTGIPSGTSSNISNRPYFAYLNANPGAGLRISKPFFGTITKTWQINFARRINRPDGSFFGVAYGTFDIQKLTDIFHSLVVGSHGNITLADDDFEVVSRYAQPGGPDTVIGRFIRSPQLHKLVQQGRTSGVYNSVSPIDRETRTIYFRKFSDYPFYLFVGLAPRDYLADWKAHAIKVAGLVALFVLFSGFLYRYLLLQKKRETRAEEMLHKANEELEERVRRRTADLASANRALRHEIMERMQSEEQLREINQRFSAVFNSESVGIAFSNFVDGRFVDANATFITLFGYEKEEIIGHTSLELGLWGDPAERERITRLLRSQGCVPQFDAALRHRSGHPLHLLISFELVERAGEKLVMGIFSDISARKHYEQELEKAHEELRAVNYSLKTANKQLSQFSENLAHELRTPLHQLMLEADMALSRERSREEYREVIGSGMEAYERLQRLVDSLLFLARAENQNFRISPEPIDLCREFENIVDFYSALLEEKGIAPVVACQGALVADPTLFNRAVANLFENALKYTPAGGSITLSGKQREDGTVEVEVSDSGCGIEPELVPRIFDRYFWIEKSHQDGTHGTGLGLDIVKAIMNLHGGSIGIRSEPGAGTTVTLRFPSRQAGLP